MKGPRGNRTASEDSQHLPGEEVSSVVEVRIDRYPVAQHAAVGRVVRAFRSTAAPQRIVTSC